MMRNIFPAALAAWAFVAAAADAPSGGQPVEPVDDDSILERYFAFQTELNFYSAYIWRGQIICDRPVWQPAQDVYLKLGEQGEYGAIKLRVWADFYINGHRAPHRFGGMSIVDETVSYTKTFADCLDFEAGGIMYQFPNRHGMGMRETDELLAGIRYRNPYLTPRVYVYWDFDTNGHNDENALYFDFDFTHAFALTEALSLTLGSGFGVGNGSYMENYTKGAMDGIAFACFHSDMALYYRLTEWLKVGGSLSYFYNLSRQVRHTNYDLNDAYNAGILRGGIHFVANF